MRHNLRQEPTSSEVCSRVDSTFQFRKGGGCRGSSDGDLHVIHFATQSPLVVVSQFNSQVVLPMILHSRF